MDVEGPRLPLDLDDALSLLLRFLESEVVVMLLMSTFYCRSLGLCMSGDPFDNSIDNINNRLIGLVDWMFRCGPRGAPRKRKARRAAAAPSRK